MSEKKPFTICYVEDDEIIRNSISAIIERRLGVKLHQFSEPEDALVFIKDNDVDCLITDLTFDYEINGTFKLITELKEKKPDARIIVSSGMQNSQQEKEIFFALGPNATNIGTGDDADTPAMRIRAERRKDKPVTAKMIDFIVPKPLRSSDIDKLVQYLISPNTEKGALR